MDSKKAYWFYGAILASVIAGWRLNTFAGWVSDIRDASVKNEEIIRQNIEIKAKLDIANKHIIRIYSDIKLLNSYHKNDPEEK